MTDLAELFSRDPRKLTRDDLTALITKMRESRGQFNLGNMKAGSMKPKTEKQKQAAELAGALKLDLSALVKKS